MSSTKSGSASHGPANMSGRTMEHTAAPAAPSCQSTRNTLPPALVHLSWPSFSPLGRQVPFGRQHHAQQEHRNAGTTRTAHARGEGSHALAEHAPRQQLWPGGHAPHCPPQHTMRAAVLSCCCLLSAPHQAAARCKAVDGLGRRPPHAHVDASLRGFCMLAAYYLVASKCTSRRAQGSSRLEAD